MEWLGGCRTREGGCSYAQSRFGGLGCRSSFLRGVGFEEFKDQFRDYLADDLQVGIEGVVIEGLNPASVRVSRFRHKECVLGTRYARNY